MAIIDYDIRVHPIGIEIKSSPAHCCSVEEEIDGNPWYMDIKRFIQYREYPSGALSANKKTLRRMSIEWYIDGEVLYKMLFDGSLLRCLNESEANKALHKVHGEIYTTHTNRHMMARQMQRAKYFLMTMEKDCIEFVRKCHKYQVYSYKINVPPVPLFNMVSPWPFAMWEIYVIGLINPKATNEHWLLHEMDRSLLICPCDLEGGQMIH